MFIVIFYVISPPKYMNPRTKSIKYTTWLKCSIEIRDIQYDKSIEPFAEFYSLNLFQMHCESNGMIYAQRIQRITLW